jgi:uncharacterized protein YjeT (DUF2065 family)
MLILIKLIGIMIAGAGLTLFAAPQMLRKVVDYIAVGKRFYWAGVIRSAIGLLLFLASTQSTIPLAALCVGMIFLLSGLIAFACDLEKTKTWMASSAEMPVLIIRLLGLLGSSFGVLILSIF